MKAAESPYIRENKPLFRKLLAELLEKYPYASILASDVQEKDMRVSRHITNVTGSGIFSARGFVVKVFDGQHWSEHSFNAISEALLPDILTAVMHTAGMAESVLPASTREAVFVPLREEKTVFSGSTDCAVPPESLGDDTILSRLTAIRDKGLAYSNKVLDVVVRLGWCRTSKLFLSREKDLEQNILWTDGGVAAVAARGEELKQSYASISCLGGLELMDRIEQQVEPVASVALELLESESIAPGEYECICTPPVTGMIVHEAFGHGVEMDMFVKKRALAEQYIGQAVASPLVTMHDGAAAAAQTGTYFFDDEGIMAHDTVIIDKGILQTGISDYASAVTLGTEPTGNGRRESYRRKAYTRMTNTWFEGGHDSVEDMIASVQDGLLLDQPASGMEDPKNWGIQCMVSFAREIKNGRLTGRIFSPIVLTGYVPDLLKSITMMSPAVELDGGGMCGKGYKEWVKVSDGGPYIKARIRLG